MEYTFKLNWNIYNINELLIQAQTHVIYLFIYYKQVILRGKWGPRTLFEAKVAGSAIYKQRETV